MEYEDVIALPQRAGLCVGWAFEFRLPELLLNKDMLLMFCTKLNS